MGLSAPLESQWFLARLTPAGSPAGERSFGRVRREKGRGLTPAVLARLRGYPVEFFGMGGKAFQERGEAG